MITDAQFDRLAKHLERLLKLDLTAYKPQQMRRRVGAFVERNGGDADLDAFLRRLDQDAVLLRALRDMITINVTEFFRDPAQWAQFQRDVLPELTRERPTLQIWSAGCSHGQEPISLAIALDRIGALDRSRITATDYDRQVLDRARAGGPYRDEEVAGIPPKDRETYFTRGTEGLTAKPSLLLRIRHRELNLLTDNFGTGYDLIACRNVMIYFEPAVRSRLLHRFFEALRPGGVLFIGATEALLGADADGFDRLGGNFYRRSVELRQAA